MEKIMTFDTWVTIEEAKKTLSEAEGVSKAIFGTLQNFFDEYGEGSYEQAKEYVASKVKGWDLSQEDFEEAKKMMKESSENDDDSRLDEGKMKEISMISQEATSAEDFKNKLKTYLRSIGKGDLVNDKEFMDSMVSDWKKKK